MADDTLPFRPPRSRVTRLAAVSVMVPAPEETAGFLAEALGFVVTPSPSGGVQVSCAGEYGIPAPASMLDLLPAESAKSGPVLHGLRFDVDQDYDLDALASRFAVLGAVPDGRPRADRPGATPEEVSFVDPNGVHGWCGTAGPAYTGTLPAAPVRPRRLGHVNVTVADPAATAGFFIDTLGLRLSEQIGKAFYFLRVGSEHHNLGVRSGGPQPGVHHVGFEIHGWESYRVVCDHLADLGYRVEYGPGRHGPGHNLFVYLRDPSSGLRLELYSDMAHIDDEARYVAPHWELSDRSNTVNRWGPAPPESFLE